METRKNKRASEGKDEPGAKRLRTSRGEEEEELQRPEKPLWDAAYDGDLQTVKQWVEVHHANVNEGNEDYGGATPLFAAVYQGHTEIVRCLVERPGVDVNQATTDIGETPLYICLLYTYPSTRDLSTSRMPSSA